MIDDYILTETEYRLNGKIHTTVWSVGFPPIEVGKYIVLETNPTDREKQRRPARKYSETVFFVLDIVPKIRQHVTRPHHFYHAVEVYLREATDNDKIERN